MRTRQRRCSCATIAMGSVLAVALACAPAALAQDRPSPAPQPGVTCIGLNLPSIRGAAGSATEMAGSVRELVASYLTGPAVRTLDLEARLPQQALAEARGKDCGLLLVTTLTRKQRGKGMASVIGQAAGDAAWYIPYGGTAAGAAARGAAIAGSRAVSSMAANTRAKDELLLEYRLLTSAGAPAKQGSEKAKASADGEDLITPLVERMATAVFAALPKLP